MFKAPKNFMEENIMGGMQKRAVQECINKFKSVHTVTFTAKEVEEISRSENGTVYHFKVSKGNGVEGRATVRFHDWKAFTEIDDFNDPR